MNKADEYRDLGKGAYIAVELILKYLRGEESLDCLCKYREVLDSLLYDCDQQIEKLRERN